MGNDASILWTVLNSCRNPHTRDINYLDVFLSREPTVPIFPRPRFTVRGRLCPHVRKLYDNVLVNLNRRPLLVSRPVLQYLGSGFTGSEASF